MMPLLDAPKCSGPHCDPVYRPRALIWCHYSMLQNVIRPCYCDPVYIPAHWYDAITRCSKMFWASCDPVYRPRALIWGHYTMLQNVIRPCYCDPVYRPRDWYEAQTILQNVLGLIVILYIGPSIDMMPLHDVQANCYGPHCDPVYRPRA
jgi:hypothetical protein